MTFKTILKYIVLLVCGYKFATADKEDKTPTWYGIWMNIWNTYIKKKKV